LPPVSTPHSSQRSLTRYFYWVTAVFTLLLVLVGGISLALLDQTRHQSDSMGETLLPRSMAAERLSMDAGHLAALGADIPAAVNEAERQTVLQRIASTKAALSADLEQLKAAGLGNDALIKISDTVQSLTAGSDLLNSLIDKETALQLELSARQSEALSLCRGVQLSADCRLLLDILAEPGDMADSRAEGLALLKPALQSQRELQSIQQRRQNMSRRQSEMVGRLLFVASSQSDDASQESIRLQKETTEWTVRIEWLLGLVMLLALMLLFGARTLYRQRIANRLSALETAMLHWRDNRDWPSALKPDNDRQPDEIDDMYRALRELLEEVDKRTAELNRSNAELEQFAYVASHDLRQPLRMVASYLTLIQRRLGDAIAGDVKDYFGFAVDGANRMDQLILDLLDYSRIGRLGPAFEPVAVGQAIATALTNLTPAIADSKAVIHVTDDFPTVMGSESALTRLFQNLINNAITYQAPERTPKLEIGWKDGGSEWIVWVKDNGMGIRTEDFERVFGVFQRLVSRQQFEGTGIGLAVCKKIVEHHSGRIWIESRLGEGSSFFIALPKTA